MQTWYENSISPDEVHVVRACAYCSYREDGGSPTASRTQHQTYDQTHDDPFEQHLVLVQYRVFRIEKLADVGAFLEQVFETEDRTSPNP